MREAVSRLVLMRGSIPRRNPESAVSANKNTNGGCEGDIS